MKLQSRAAVTLSTMAIIFGTPVVGTVDEIEDCEAVMTCDKIISSDQKRRFFSMDFETGKSTLLSTSGGYYDIALSARSDSFFAFISMFAVNLRNIYRITGFCKNSPPEFAFKIGQDYHGSYLNAMTPIDDGSSDILIMAGEDGIIREFDISTSGPGARNAPTTIVGTFPCDGTSGDMVWNANDGLIYAAIKGCTEVPYSCGGDALFVYNRTDQTSSFKACFTLDHSPIDYVYGMAYLGATDTMVVGTTRYISPYGYRLYSVDLESGIMKPGPEIRPRVEGELSYRGTNGLTTIPCPVPYCNKINDYGGCCDDFCDYEVIEHSPICASNWTEDCVDLACGDNGICGADACSDQCMKGKDLLCSSAPTSEAPSNTPSLEPSRSGKSKSRSSKSSRSKSKRAKSETWAPSTSPSDTPFCNVENTAGGCCHELCEALVVKYDPSCSTSSWSQDCVDLACGESGICSSSACNGECLSSNTFCAHHNIFGP